MQKAKYTAEFKEEAVRQVIDRGHSVIDVAKRLGIGDGLLYTWVKKFKAVLGWLIEIHGQGGPVAIYQGAFKDKYQFFQHLADCDFLLDSKEQNLTDETILRIWTKPSKPVAR